MCDRAPEMMDLLESIGIVWESVYRNCHVPYVIEGLYADRIHVYEGGGAGGDGIVLTEIEHAEAKKLGIVKFRNQTPNIIHLIDKGLIATG